MVGLPVYCAAMSPFLPLQLLLVIFAGWVNRHQSDVIEYLQEENRVLKEHLGGRRIRLTDTERRRLARRAHTLGRKVLNELRTLVTPVSEECLATTIGPRPDECRYFFWTIRRPRLEFARAAGGDRSVWEASGH